MTRTTTILAFFTISLFAGIGLPMILSSAGCYDMKNVPPCDPKHPDPTLGCFATKVPDAGNDG